MDRKAERCYLLLMYDNFLPVVIHHLATQHQHLRLAPKPTVVTLNQTRTRNSQYWVSGINTPWHAPVPWHFTGMCRRLPGSRLASIKQSLKSNGRCLNSETGLTWLPVVVITLVPSPRALTHMSGVGAARLLGRVRLNEVSQGIFSHFEKNNSKYNAFQSILTLVKPQGESANVFYLEFRTLTCFLLTWDAFYWRVHLKTVEKPGGGVSSFG